MPTRFVYFIQKGRGGPIKIGVADNVARRVLQLQTGSDRQLRILATFVGDESLERELHGRFEGFRMHGEWFMPAPEVFEYIADQFRAHAKAEPLTLELQEQKARRTFCGSCFDDSEYRCEWYRGQKHGYDVPGHHHCGCSCHAGNRCADDLGAEERARLGQAAREARAALERMRAAHAKR